MDLLFGKILTKDDVLYLKEKILKLQQEVFRKAGSLSEKAKEVSEKELVEIIFDSEKKGKISLDPKKQFDYLENLQKELDDLPVLKMVLAFSPSPEIIKRISQFVREGGEKIVLDIAVNPEIIGGVILEYKGKYLDLSFCKEVKNFIEKKWKHSKNI